MKNCIPHICAAIALSASAALAGDIVLFDAKSGAGKISEASRAQMTPGGCKISRGRAEILGEWDLSKNLDFEIEVKNLSETSDCPLQILLSDGENADKVKDHTWNTMFRLAPGESRRVIVKYPRPPAHPEVAAKMKGMRADPFGYMQNSNRPDLSKIRTAAIERHWSSNAPFEIRFVRALEHDPDGVPAWRNFGEKEFFPFIDRFGQFKFRDWPGKTHSEADLEAARRAEERDLAANPGPADRDRFGGWTKGGKFRASGHFRFEKAGGKWWMVDPDGNLFWSHGVVRVTPSSAITPLDGRKFYFDSLPEDGDDFAIFYTTKDELLAPYYEARKIKKTYDFSAANIFRKYGRHWRDAYAETAHKRLKSWGMNTIANSSDKDIFMRRKTPYVERFEIKGPALSGKAAWWPFRDPFAPEFRKNVAENLKSRADMTSDPWCIGFFVDNEIHWGDKRDLARFTIMSPAALAGKIRFKDELEKKYGDISGLNKAWGTKFSGWDAFLQNRELPEKADEKDLEDFTSLMAEEYFKVIRGEFDKFAPNKLYLGCRFSDANDSVLKIGAKYCDAVSYNRYSDDLKGLKLPKGVDKPVMIGEWHFGALDRGLFHPSLIKMESQADRADAYYKYAKSALENPNIVGIHWHQFSDQATTGRFDGENFQVGLTDVCDTPYAETIAKIREIGRDLYEIRASAPLR